MSQIVKRPRRLRQNASVRDLVGEVRLSLKEFIQPYFLTEGSSSKEPIQGFTNVFRWGIDSLSSQIEKDIERGLQSFLLFGGSDKKDPKGTSCYDPKGLVARTLRSLKERFGDNIILMTDVCLCPYTSHGHCGVLSDEGIDNDASLGPLSQMALCHAEAGADFVAPSDMMDGRVGSIRTLLDEKGYSRVGILSYTAKYASSYYGPFREALDSSPSHGDRTTHQMDFRNATDALRELHLDLAEGADIVMVKPALPYLDIIAKFKQESDVPVAAYCVSAEYEMVKQLVASGMAEERKMVIENLTAIRRAGAHIVVTYYASELAEKRWLE